MNKKNIPKIYLPGWQKLDFTLLIVWLKLSIHSHYCVVPEDVGGTPPENYDPFHIIIFFDELARCACGGLIASLFSYAISLPCIIAVGSQELKDRVVKDVLSGRKMMALCVTEPQAGFKTFCLIIINYIATILYNPTVVFGIENPKQNLFTEF